MITAISIIEHFFFSISQGSLLTLSSEITSGGGQGTVCGAGTELMSATFKTSTLFIIQPLWLIQCNFNDEGTEYKK